MRSEAVEAEAAEPVGLAAVALVQAEAAAQAVVVAWQPRSWPAQLKLRLPRSAEADVEARADWAASIWAGIAVEARADWAAWASWGSPRSWSSPLSHWPLRSAG